MDISFFRSHSLTKGLDHGQLERLDAVLTREHFAAGSRLCTEGTRSRGLWVVREGSVEVFKKGEHGEHLLATLQAPTVLGELELVSGDPSSASVRAKSEVVAYLLPSEQFEAWVDSGDAVVSKLMRNIAKVVVHRLSETNKRVVDMLEPSQLAKYQAVQQNLATEWT